jgi:hypothetical protein
MKHCSPAVLVGLDIELPADRGVANEGMPPRVGCKHLVCDECKCDVRHVDGRTITSHYPPARLELLALYDSPDPASSPYFDATPVNRNSRAYFCRCAWAAVSLGGWKMLGSIDAPWGCAGHEEAVDEPRAEAVAPAVTAAPSLGEKIRIACARGVAHELATASELRNRLLASYPEAGYFGAPVVDKGGDNVAPAWGWVVDLIRMRSDWWPSIGIALQHAVADGGHLARTAFADLLAEYRDSLVLLPWTAETAATIPDARARGTGTGWGAPDLRLETIVRDQRKYVEDLAASGSEVALLGYGKRGTLIEAQLADEDDLRALLQQTADAGRFPDGDLGPWSWLGFEMRTRGEWMRAAFSRIVVDLDETNEPRVLALLDWFSEEQDLWMFAPLLESWCARPPAWAMRPANSKPKGWARAIRGAQGPDVRTLGDVALAAMGRAKKQVATPPVLDLALLHGPRSPG